MKDELLSNLFGSRLRAKVLGWLFTHTDERYFVRQLTALLGEDSTNLSRELSRLEKMGLLISTTSGKQKYYQTDPQSPIFNELHNLMIKTAGLYDILRFALAPAGERITLAFVFGSFASANENRSSDIDVMIIGDIKFTEVINLFSPVQKSLSREINPVVYPVAEFISRVREEHYFIKNILSDRKIFLVGDESVLNRLVQSRTDNEAQAEL